MLVFILWGSAHFKGKLKIHIKKKFGNQEDKTGAKIIFKQPPFHHHLPQGNTINFLKLKYFMGKVDEMLENY